MVKPWFPVDFPLNQSIDMADMADMADFQVPQSSLPQLTASIGAMARYNGRELPAAPAAFAANVPSGIDIVYCIHALCVINMCIETRTCVKLYDILIC